MANKVHVWGGRAELGKNKRVGGDSFKWLAGREKGVYVVRVYERLVTDHCIVVSGSRKLILDSEERYPLQLTEDCLRLCGGVDAKLLKVGEIREVVVQSKTVNKRKRKAEDVIDLTK